MKQVQVHPTGLVDPNDPQAKVDPTFLLFAIYIYLCVQLRIWFLVVVGSTTTLYYTTSPTSPPWTIYTDVIPYLLSYGIVGLPTPRVSYLTSLSVCRSSFLLQKHWEDAAPSYSTPKENALWMSWVTATLSPERYTRLLALQMYCLVSSLASLLLFNSLSLSLQFTHLVPFFISYQPHIGRCLACSQRQSDPRDLVACRPLLWSRHHEEGRMYLVTIVPVVDIKVTSFYSLCPAIIDHPS